MPPYVLRLIVQEHRALGAVLRALDAQIAQAHRPGAQPDFAAMRAMLFYMNEVPARVHHSSESELLFPCIRKRCPALSPVLERLETEHARGESAVRELEHGLMAWELMGDARREAFEVQLQAYADSYAGHMEVEERYVMPVALDYLTPEDWLELEAGFRRQRARFEPGHACTHRALFERIINRKRITEA